MSQLWGAFSFFTRIEYKPTKSFLQCSPFFIRSFQFDSRDDRLVVDVKFQICHFISQLQYLNNHYLAVTVFLISMTDCLCRNNLYGIF